MLHAQLLMQYPQWTHRLQNSLAFMKIAELSGGDPTDTDISGSFFNRGALLLL